MIVRSLLSQLQQFHDLGCRWIVICLMSLMVLGFTPHEPALALASPLNGLMELRQLQQDSTPYETAIANQKPMLIEFYATWCSVCRDMAPTMRQLHEHYAEDINFVLLDVDDPRWLQQVRTFHVNAIPQITLLDAEQQILGTQVGKVPASILAQTLDQLLPATP